MSSPTYGRRAGDRKPGDPAPGAIVDADPSAQLHDVFAEPSPFAEAGHQLVATGFLSEVGDERALDVQVILVNQGVAPLREVSLELLSFSDGQLRPLDFEHELAVTYGSPALLEPGRTLRWQAGHRVRADSAAVGGELIASFVLSAKGDMGETHQQQLDAIIPLD